MSRFPRTLPTIISLAGLVLFGVWCARPDGGTLKAGPPAPVAPVSDSTGVILYDRDPQHFWNRLHRALWVRTAPDGTEYGHDRLDPLLWSESKHLIDGQSHAHAIVVLDQFLANNADPLIEDPIKRAILQRDLWAVFDWTTEPGEANQESRRLALQVRLAQIIQKLALPAERSPNLREIYPGQIKSLPDNYTQAVKSGAFAESFDSDNPERPFLPANLFEKEGPWVELNKENGSVPVASTHVRDFRARSAFRVFLRFPEGRKATLAYLHKLRDFPQPEVPDPNAATDRDKNRILVPNPELPQFPVGTQVALVRQMLLIDKDAKLAVTPITENVQLRVYAAVPSIPSSGSRSNRVESQEQYANEFTLRRALLFAGTNGGLRPLERDEKDFATQLLVHPTDEFESSTGRPLATRVTLRSCAGCHRKPGIHSFLTYAGGFFPRGPRLPDLEDVVGGEIIPMSEGGQSAIRKRELYSWGVLRGLWDNRQTR